MLDTMPRQPKKIEVPKSESSHAAFPSRAGYKGTYLPKKLYETLEAIAKKKERSTAFLVRRAVEEYLKRHKDDSSDD